MPPSGRNSTYRPVQISGAGSVSEAVLRTISGSASPERGEVYHSTVSAHVDCSAGDCWLPGGNWFGYDQDLRSPEGRSPEGRSPEGTEGEEQAPTINRAPDDHPATQSKQTSQHTADLFPPETGTCLKCDAIALKGQPSALQFSEVGEYLHTGKRSFLPSQDAFLHGPYHPQVWLGDQE